MVLAHFGKKHIKGDGFGALCVQFLDQLSIHMSWPVEAGAIAEPATGHFLDCFVTDEDEAEVGGGRGKMLESQPHTPVVGHPFQPTEEVEVFVPMSQGLNEANQRDHNTAKR